MGPVEFCGMLNQLQLARCKHPDLGDLGPATQLPRVLGQPFHKADPCVVCKEGRRKGAHEEVKGGGISSPIAGAS